MHLNQLRVAVIATDGFEESELTEPLRALKEAGARVDVVSLKSGEIQAMRHQDKTIRVKVDKTLEQLKPGDYEAVMLPGGALNADKMRIERKLQEFLREFDQHSKPIAAICHAPWELISAGLVRGRKLTAYHTIRDDIQNAGGVFLDQEVVVDRNWVTSRQPSDLPAFNREMLNLFAHAPVAVR
jgi:protease I